MLLVSRWYINVMSGTNLTRPTARRRMIKQGNETELRNVTKEPAQRDSDAQEHEGFRLHKKKSLPSQKARSESVNKLTIGDKDEMEAGFFTISIREKK